MPSGAFSSDPKFLWLTEVGEDRRMQLLEDFSFTDPVGKVWMASAGAIVDGASIPRALWSVVGSPYTGDYRRASIVYDVACDSAKGDAKLRRAADRMYYHACRAGGCSVAQSIVQYIGVRIGALRPYVLSWSPMAPTSVRSLYTRSSADVRLEADFAQVCDLVFQPGETDDIDEIERRADDALSVVTMLDVRRM